MNIGFRFAERGHEHRAEDALSRYVVRTEARPMRQWLELAGPGRALRLIRDGSPDFSSFGELAKSLVRPGLSELERAMAIYRFSARHFYNASMGWGDTEMTRFINAFGYSFCWGQADFQHLLYEAAGLRARAPLLKGHSSTEVFVDGAWRMLDAYMRLMAPAPDLSGLATGDDLHRHPGIFDAIRSAARAETAKDYWSIHGPGGTYEPHADSAAMRLHLRRGESVRFDLDRRERWALAPAEPADFCNGRWFWQPTLDAAHLERDVQRADNVAAGAEGLAPHKAHAPALLDYRIGAPGPCSPARSRSASPPRRASRSTCSTPGGTTGSPCIAARRARSPSPSTRISPPPSCPRPAICTSAHTSPTSSAASCCAWPGTAPPRAARSRSISRSRRTGQAFPRSRPAKTIGHCWPKRPAPPCATAGPSFQG